MTRYLLKLNYEIMYNMAFLIMQSQKKYLLPHFKPLETMREGRAPNAIFFKGKYGKKLAFPEGRGSDYKNILNDGCGDFLEQEIRKDQVKMNL